MHTLHRIRPDGTEERAWTPPGDSPAARLLWTSNSRASANFANFKVVEQGDRLRVHPTLRKRLFGLFFVLMGAFFAPFVILFVGIFAGAFGEGLSEGGKWLTLLAALAFLGIFWGIGLRALFARDRFVIDLRRQRYHAGHRQPEGIAGDATRSGPLSAIVGVQLASRQVSTERGMRSQNTHRTSRWTSYQINLVRQDGQRICLLDHGDRKAVERDAALIGRRLGVEVWTRGA